MVLREPCSVEGSNLSSTYCTFFPLAPPLVVLSLVYEHKTQLNEYIIKHKWNTVQSKELEIYIDKKQGGH